ncbi:TatD family hydrolase [Candidatus Pacebacteria bacterium]|nr:TatD family hydrolase [Candidatus Paceibacterota bacterium]
MSYSFIDTHAHLNISAFDDDVAAVISKCQEEKVAVINIGTKESTSKRAVELAEQSADLYAIVGLHPIQTTPLFHSNEEIGEGSEPFKSKGEEFNKDFYRELCQSEKVVGIGECGFDFYRCDADTYATQEAAFIAQIELANELGLPLMIHTRDAAGNQASANPTGRSAYDDVYDVLKRYAKVPGNIHFYAGTYEQAKRFFDLGFTISFTGVITFAQDYAEVVQNAPLELIHAETDCPYVAPVPHRGKRCEPWMVKEVYKKIAGLKQLDEETVRLHLIQNAQKLYSIEL